MNTDNRAQRRKAAKAAGVKGQLVSAIATVPLSKASNATLAEAVVDALNMVTLKGGSPLERSAVTIGTDHPAHPGMLVVEVKTDRMATYTPTP